MKWFWRTVIFSCVLACIHILAICRGVLYSWLAMPFESYAESMASTLANLFAIAFALYLTGDE